MPLKIESTMRHSRQFLNLVVANGLPGVKSLRRMDLGPLFGAVGGPFSSTDDGNQDNKQAAPACLDMDSSLGFNFIASTSTLNQQWKIDCFPLGADRKMICADQLGRTFLLDAETRFAYTMPSLHKPKWTPFSLFVPNVDADNDYNHNGCGSTLFVMERIPKPESECSPYRSDQFEAFVYRRPTMVSPNKFWHCQLLPPPPYIREPRYKHGCPDITSYAVLGGGSHICISVEGVGTYCLDTRCHRWSEVRGWTLPFRGKVEYVPELKLWFGLSSEDRYLAAADLSDLDYQPQLVGNCKEFHPPEEWKECKDAQLINLGCGRFCIARFFHTRTLNSDSSDELIGQNFVVFTGVEVVSDVNGNANSSGNGSNGNAVPDMNGNANRCGNGAKGKVELRMTPHRSRSHVCNGVTIDTVF